MNFSLCLLNYVFGSLNLFSHLAVVLFHWCLSAAELSLPLVMLVAAGLTFSTPVIWISDCYPLFFRESRLMWLPHAGHCAVQHPLDAPVWASVVESLSLALLSPCLPDTEPPQARSAFATVNQDLSLLKLFPFNQDVMPACIAEEEMSENLSSLNHQIRCECSENHLRVLIVVTC